MNKRQIIIGLATEGTTDIHFLSSIVQRTFEQIACDCIEDIEIYEPLVEINRKKNEGLIQDKALSYARQAQENGVMILCR
jgi:hypothetical protein